MTTFISHLHDDLRRTRFSRRGSTHEPHEVPQGLHKEYPRMEKIHLPKPSPLDVSLSSVLSKRQSCAGPGTGTPITLEEWSTLFHNALGKRDGTTHRNYPSGGALYPIETYIFSEEVGGIGRGIFHYSPTLHALERLWDLPTKLHIYELVPKHEQLQPTSLMVFTSVWKRSSAKYGDFTYTVAMLEAGHMSENVILVSTALNLCTRPMAGFHDEKIISLLDLDRTLEQPVHSITFAKP